VTVQAVSFPLRDVYWNTYAPADCDKHETERAATAAIFDVRVGRR
jgi:hypothetical protein